MNCFSVQISYQSIFVGLLIFTEILILPLETIFSSIETHLFLFS